jgi:hypothetical protein
MPIKATLGCLLVLCLAACSAEPIGARAVRARAVESAPPAAEGERLPLAERLRREATRRPEAREQVERWLQDLASAGVQLVRTRQVLAAPLGADYCAAALSAHGLGVSLCEFPDAARAEQGLSRSRASFDRLIPGRALLRSGATLLTLTQASGSEAAAERAQLARRFGVGTAGEHASL